MNTKTKVGVVLIALAVLIAMGNGRPEYVIPPLMFFGGVFIGFGLREKK